MKRIRTQYQSPRFTHLGGNANNGANAGAFYWNVNNSSSNANRNIGTRDYSQTKSKDTGSWSLDRICCHKEFSIEIEKLGGGVQK